MSSIRRGVRASGGGERAKEVKYQKLLKEAGGGLLKAPKRQAQAVVEYLAIEEYFDPLIKILEPLDKHLIPVLPINFGDQIGRASMNKANEAISTFPRFFQVLLLEPPTSPHTQSYSQRCMDLLLENWSGVTGWVAYLIQMVPQLSSHAADGLLKSCVNALFTIISHINDNPMAEEMTCMPVTCDLVYILIQEMDLSTGRYRILLPGDTDTCFIAELYVHCFSSEAGTQAMLSSFTRKSRWGRRKIVQALVGRIEHAGGEAKSHIASITDQAITVALYVESLFAIATSNPGFHAMLRQEKVITRCTSAVVTLAEKARSAGIHDQSAWGRIASVTGNLGIIAVVTSPNPAKLLPPLIRAGILRSAQMCIPYAEGSITKGSPVRPLLLLTPYLYLHKVVSAATGSGGLDGDWRRTLEVTSSRLVSTPAVEAWKGFRLQLERSHAAHTSCLRPAQDSLCSNSKHALRHASPQGGRPLKTCGRCRWVTYCSEECQKEDWSGYHLRECIDVAAVANAWNLGPSKFIFELRRSQLTLLQYHLNQPETRSCLLQQIQLFQASNRVQPHHLPIPVINFAGPCSIQEGPWAGETEVFKDSLRCYTVPLCKEDDAGHWEPRYESFMSDVNWDGQVGRSKSGGAEQAGASSPSVIAVEGHFWYSPELAIRTLIKARYESRGEGDGGWSIVGSIFRTVPNRPYRRAAT